MTFMWITAVYYCSPFKIKPTAALC